MALVSCNFMDEFDITFVQAYNHRDHLSIQEPEDIEHQELRVSSILHPHSQRKLGGLQTQDKYIKKRARLNFPTTYQLRHVPATFQDAILKSPTQFHSVAPQSVQALFFWKDRIHLSNSTYQITKPLPLHPHHFLDWAFFHPPCF